MYFFSLVSPQVEQGFNSTADDIVGTLNAALACHK